MRDPLVQEHVANAIRFLELRATAQYEDEFVEQRWAVMFQLGSIYMSLKVSATVYIFDEMKLKTFLANIINTVCYRTFRGTI